jgi:hypothetical protein
VDSSGYEEYEPQDDHRPYSAGGEPSSTRRKRRQRQASHKLERLESYEYHTTADGDLFRLFELLPGTGTQPVEGKLDFEYCTKPERVYTCLSYCWETVEREAEIICNGFLLPVTKNLLAALKCLRDPKRSYYIWIDQICINQDDSSERGHQVSIMEHIFSQAKDVIVWLGEEDDKSKKLCQYARKMKRREDDSPKQTLKRILNPRQLQDAIQKLLQRPWFQRVWVVPEVALARFTTVQIGQDQISWDNMVRLIKDTPLPQAGGFDKQIALLGNPRQRIAIITQMSASNKIAYHTDIAQLLILGKGSNATDLRDFVYAFYGLTYLRTKPDYRLPVEIVFADVIQHYINSIRLDPSYSKQHDLAEEQRTQQLMSILYSAGALHQHFPLPSWIPDWTFSWHLAPVWCKTTSNIITGSFKDEWSSGIRSDFRAGGDRCGEFEVLAGPQGMHRLLVSAILFDTITIVSETTPASTPGLDEEPHIDPDPSLKYGRTFFRTGQGYVGISTPGVQAGDNVAIILGGDVPVIVRSCGSYDEKTKAYKLLCECFVLSGAVMQGEITRSKWTLAEDIVFL